MNTHTLLTVGDNPSQSVDCFHFTFGLIVTGEGEREHLPKLFKSLERSGICSFKVIGRTGQLSPISAPRRKQKMVGKGKSIPDKDAERIGFPARKHLTANSCNRIILVDDLENARRPIAQQVFERYRLVFDTILPDYQRERAAVHFLVNMLEAYYFADANAVNATLYLQPPLEDYSGDVEIINHPKSELKKLYPGFHEIDDGGKILDQLDVEHVLSRSDTCASLRTLFAWCVNAMVQSPVYDPLPLMDMYRLADGIQSEITRNQ